MAGWNIECYIPCVAQIAIIDEFLFSMIFTEKSQMGNVCATTLRDAHPFVVDDRFPPNHPRRHNIAKHLSLTIDSIQS
jgi:hypothetical protein